MVQQDVHGYAERFCYFFKSFHPSGRVNVFLEQGIEGPGACFGLSA